MNQRMNNDDTWRTPGFREGIIAKMEEATQQSSMPTRTTSYAMEGYVFNEAKSKEEYLEYTDQLIFLIRDINSTGSEEMNMALSMQPTSSGPMSTFRAATQSGTPGQTMCMPPQGGFQHINPAPYLRQSLNQRPDTQSELAAVQNGVPAGAMQDAVLNLMGELMKPLPGVYVHICREDTSWKTPSSRANMVAKIEEAVQQSAMMIKKTSSQMESEAFNTTKTKEEYFGYIARLILHIRELGRTRSMKYTMPSRRLGPPAPMNTFRAMAQPGTPVQMMSMPPQGGPQQINPASNLLQSLNKRPAMQNNVAAMQNGVPTRAMQGPFFNLTGRLMTPSPQANIDKDDSWKTPSFRANITSRIEDAVQRSAMPTERTSSQIERCVFNKAKTKEEYLGYTARVILHFRDLGFSSNEPGQKKINNEASPRSWPAARLS